MEGQRSRALVGPEGQAISTTKCDECLSGIVQAFEVAQWDGEKHLVCHIIGAIWRCEKHFRFKEQPRNHIAIFRFKKDIPPRDVRFSKEC